MVNSKTILVRSAPVAALVLIQTFLIVVVPSGYRRNGGEKTTHDNDHDTNNTQSKDISEFLMFLSGNVSESKFHYIECKHGPSRLYDCKGLQPLFEKSIVAVFPLPQEDEEGGKNNASNHASNLSKVSRIASF